MKRLKQKTYGHRAKLSLWLTLILGAILSCSGPASNEDAGKLNSQTSFDKLSIDHAIGFDIVYHDTWKELHLFRHYNDAIDTVSYALVSNLENRPDGYSANQLIQVPVQNIAAMSTTHIGMFDKLAAFDHLKGIEMIKYISNSQVQSRFEKGEITELSPAGGINTEVALAEGIELVLGVGYPNSSNDAYQSLERLGIPVILNAEWQELDLLGRAEWIKLLAALTNKEKEATKYFDSIKNEFQQTLSLLENRGSSRPKVITGLAQGDSWYVAGGNSFSHHLLELVEVEYPWANDQSTGSVRLSFEAVYQAGLDADYWMVPSTAITLDDIKAADPRFEDFKSFKNQNIYNIYGRYTEGRGNDFYESAVVQPHIVLKDIVKIFYPELLPEHQLYYYNRLK